MTHRLAEQLPVLAGYDGPAMIDEAGGSLRTEAAVAALAGALGDAIATDEVLAVQPLGGGRGGSSRGKSGTQAAGLVCAGRGTAGAGPSAGAGAPRRCRAHIRLTFAGPQPAAPGLQDSSGAFGGSCAPPCRATPATRSASRIQCARPRRGALERRDAWRPARPAPAPTSRPCPASIQSPWDRAPGGTQLDWGADGVAVWRAGDAAFLVGHDRLKHAPLLGSPSPTW